MSAPAPDSRHETSPNRRGARRRNLRLEVRFPGLEGTEVCETTDVSLTGAFVATEDPASVDQVVWLRTAPRPGPGVSIYDDPIEVLGRVCWVRDVEESIATGEPPGMGLELLPPAEEHAERWRNLVEGHADHGSVAKLALLTPVATRIGAGDGDGDSMSDTYELSEDDLHALEFEFEDEEEADAAADDEADAQAETAEVVDVEELLDDDGVVDMAFDDLTTEG